MRCRYCRKELSVLKKLADTDFCSAEHRDLFLQDQQQRTLELLAKSRRRLTSRRVSTRPPLIDPNPAPAPPWQFLPAAVRYCTPAATGVPQPDFLICTAAAIPCRPAALAVRHRTAGPLWHAGLGPLDQTSIVRCAAFDPIASCAPEVPVLDRDLPPGHIGYGRLLRARPRTGRDRLLPRAIAGVCAEQLSGGCSIPCLGLHVCGNSVPEQCAGPVRTRPYRAVSCDSLKSAEYISPVARSWATAAGVPAGWSTIAGCEPAPAGSTRLHLRPADGGLGRIRGSVALVPGRCDSWARVLNGRDSATYAYEPARSTRLFRARPACGEAAEPRPLLIRSDPAEFVPFVAFSGASERILDGAPRLSTRLFRAKPRTGIADPALAVVSTASVTAHAAASHPRLPRLSCHVTGLNPNAVPPAITRPWPLRPRSGVFSRSLAANRTILPFAAPVAGALARPAMQVAVRSWVPPAETKLYRMRPRRPVDDARVSSLHVPDAQILASAGPAPSIRGLEPVPFTPGLQFATRTLRIRPRSGVSARETPEAVGCVSPSPVPVSARSPHVSPAIAGPRLIERLYRMRPRTGVNWLAAAHTLEPGAALGWEWPDVPTPVTCLPACAPRASERVYRMRPRNPVASPFAADQRSVTTGPAEPAEIFVMPPVPQLRVEWAFELRRPDRPARLNPPGPLGGIGGGIRPRSGEDEEADPAMVARSMSGAVFPSIHLPPYAPAHVRRPLIDCIRHYFAWPAWLNTPGLRLAGCGAPVLAAVLVYAATRTPDLAGSRIVSSAAPPLASTVSAMRDSMAARSAIEYTDNFSSGLHDWTGARNWSESWSYDASGGVKVGAPALLKPTLDLRDYAFEFVAQIEHSGLGFLARAADIDNGYAVKLVIVRPGPVPAVDIVRYALVGGKAHDRVEKRLPMTVYEDTIYNVRLDVREDTYSLSVNGQLVDAWSDTRFPAGGVGLFTGRGERARFLKLRISHQDDAIGRALAFVVKDASQPAKRISR